MRICLERILNYQSIDEIKSELDQFTHIISKISKPLLTGMNRAYENSHINYPLN